MYVCILDPDGQIVLHRNMHTTPEMFLRAIAPYREDIVVAVECIFTWYWLSDLCAQEGIPFVLGHALYMKAIHGVNDHVNRAPYYHLKFPPPGYNSLDFGYDRYVLRARYRGL